MKTADLSRALLQSVCGKSSLSLSVMTYSSVHTHNPDSYSCRSAGLYQWLDLLDPSEVCLSENESCRDLIRPEMKKTAAAGEKACVALSTNVI